MYMSLTTSFYIQCLSLYLIIVRIGSANSVRFYFMVQIFLPAFRVQNPYPMLSITTKAW